MSELIVTPELALSLQHAAREAGYTNYDLSRLASETFLRDLLPVLIDQGTIVEQRRIKPFTRISWKDQLSREQLLQNLDISAVGLTDWAKALLNETSYVTPLEEGEAYDIFLLQGSDLGVWPTHRYPRWVYETRAFALGLELGPPILALYAQACIGFRASCCHVASEPFSNNGYTAQYFYISSTKELHTELDVFDNEVARSAFLTRETILGVHQWLFFKRVE